MRERLFIVSPSFHTKQGYALCFTTGRGRFAALYGKGDYVIHEYLPDREAARRAAAGLGCKRPGIIG